MEEWKVCKIEETSIRMIDGDRGKNYPKSNEFFSNGYCLFLNANNVTSDGFVFKENSFINKEKDSVLKNGRLQRNDVVITTRGTVGNIALYDMSVPFDTIRINSGMLILKSGKDILPEYLFYYLKSQAFQTQLSQFVTGSAQPQLPKSTLAKMNIFFPTNINTQKLIVDILRSFDIKIKNNLQINNNLETQAQALFKSWFVDFEPFKGSEFVESEMGLIPKGWRVELLGNITTLKNDKVKKRNDVKVLSPVTTGELIPSEEYFSKQVFSESIAKYIIVKPFDFAYNPARVNIGSLGMNTYDFDGCVSPVYVVFRCEEDYHYFFDLFRRTNMFNEEVRTRAIGGVRQTLGYKDFSLIKFVLPPKSIVKDFNMTYTKMLTVMDNNKRENFCLAQLRDTLLPRLMSGELKVNEIE